MTRPGRRQYAKHSGDAFDRFITERSQDERGQFSLIRMVELFDAIDCPDHFIPVLGNAGTKRMTAGINLRSWCADGLIRFKDGSTIQLNIEEGQ